MNATYKLCAALISQKTGIGVRRFARAVGLAESTVYDWGREPMSIRNPDGTGALNLLDRIEGLIETGGSVPRARSTMLLLEQWIQGVFNRVLRGSDPDAISHAEIVTIARTCCREHGQAMDEALREGDDDVALMEALQTRDCYDRLIAVLQARIDYANGEEG